MKRSILTALVLPTLALLVGITSGAPVAYAEDCAAGYTQTESGNFYNSSGNPCEVVKDSPEVTESADSNITLEASPAPDPAVANTPNNNVGKPSEGDIMGRVMVWIMSLFAWLLGVAAIALNYAVYYTVVIMGTYVNQLSAIGVTWQVMRDIGNIMIIFGFLAAGLMTIMNTEQYGFGRKMLPMLLVGAIFINFSLFFAESIIDAGNLFATQFYTQINNGQITPPSMDLSSFSQSIKNEGISNKIMSQLGLATIYSGALEGNTLEKGSNQLFVGFMSIILFIIAAFVMFTLAFILISRFVILLYLIIIAPIGFAGLAIPKLKASADWWWKTLVEQTITAPILLLLLYVALAVITDARFLTGFGVSKDNASNAGAALGFISDKNLPGFASFILSFLVAMGLLLAVVIISKKISAFGASGAAKLAGGLTFGATAWAGRRTGGRLAYMAAAKMRTSKYFQGKAGRAVISAFDKGAHASFDMRGATTFGGMKALGFDAGKAQEGGFHHDKEEAVKKHVEHAKSIAKAIDDHEHVTEADMTTGQRNKAATAAVENAAQGRKDAVEARVNAQQARIAVLQQKVDAATQAGTADAAAVADLTRAKEAMNPDKKALAEATTNLNKATKAREEWDGNDTENADKAFKDRLKKAQIAAQKRYADSIDGSIIAGLMYGPGPSAAAKKIIKEAVKSEKDKLVETIQGFANQAGGGGAAAAHTTTAPATPAATGTGGAGAAAHGTGHGT